MIFNDLPLKTTFSLKNIKILRPKDTKSLQVWPKKFCDYGPCCFYFLNKFASKLFNAFVQVYCLLLRMPTVRRRVDVLSERRGATGSWGADFINAFLLYLILKSYTIFYCPISVIPKDLSEVNLWTTKFHKLTRVKFIESKIRFYL